MFSVLLFYHCVEGSNDITLSILITAESTSVYTSYMLTCTYMLLTWLSHSRCVLRPVRVESTEPPHAWMTWGENRRKKTKFGIFGLLFMNLGVRAHARGKGIATYPFPCGQELLVSHLFWVVCNSKHTTQKEAISWNCKKECQYRFEWCVCTNFKFPSRKKKCLNKSSGFLLIILPIML